MLPPPLFNRKAADSLIMTYCNRTAYWIFQDTMPKPVDAPLRLISMMWQQPSHLHFSQYCRPIHSLWKDGIMQPIDCWMCKIWNCWQAVDAHIKHIETACVHSTLLCNESYTHFWRPALCLYVLSFASRSFVTSHFLINCYLRYLSVKWRGTITFPHFRLAFNAM